MFLVLIFYINDVVSYFNVTDYHTPKLAYHHISVLRYVDDAVILSRSPAELTRVLHSFTLYCDNQLLVINHHKAKVMFFGKYLKLRTWSINNQRSEQVNTFRYLCMVVWWCRPLYPEHPTAIMLQIRVKVSISLNYSAQGKVGFYTSCPQALSIKDTYIISQLLYRMYLGPPMSCFTTVQWVQSKLLRAILQVCKCIPISMICLETQLLKVTTKISLSLLFLWFKIKFQLSRPFSSYFIG